jgi:hypothetical protein
VTSLLAERPGWWRHFVQLAANFGDVAAILRQRRVVGDRGTSRQEI